MDNCKIGVIGLPGKWSTETLADTVEKKTGFRLVIDMDHVSLDIKTNTLNYQGHNLCDLDAIIIKKIGNQYSPNSLDRLELLRVAENSGVKIFSRPEKILRLIDRLSCTVTLRNADIPMPQTVITEDIATAIAAVELYNVAIFKPLYSSKARGMCVISKKEGKVKVRKAVEAFKENNEMMYIQQKVAIGGRDMSLMFLGGCYLGAYARVAKKNEWNTTINSGGSYAAAKPSDEIITMAAKAQDLFGMSYTTVDVAETKHGAIVFEVSAFGGFRGAKEGLNQDVAAFYVEHVLAVLHNSQATLAAPISMHA